MNGLSYQRLEKIMNSVPHYRGNKDRFPLGARRQNNKYFLVREEGGSRVFDIVYGYRWEKHTTTKDEWLARGGEEGKGNFTYQKYDEQGNAIPDALEYGWYETVPCVMGTVRSDETFEFTREIYYQGDRGFLSQFSTGWFTNKSRHGGMVHTTAYNAKITPIWKGMKINIGDMTPTQPYKVVIHHVDRKRAKDMLKGYQHFFKVSEVMLKSMPMETFLTTAQEIVDEAMGVDAHKSWHKQKDYLALAQERVDSAPLDAFVFYALAHDVGRLCYLIRWNNGTVYNRDTTTEGIFYNLKRKLSKELYLQHSEVFNPVEYEGGKAYPACDWGVKIIVDGQEVEQL